MQGIRLSFWLPIAVAAFTLLAAPHASAAPDTARLTASRLTAPPTGLIRLRGSGFAPGERIDVFLDRRFAAAAATGAEGDFGPTDLRLPASIRPGGHWLTAVGRRSGRSGQIRIRVSTSWPTYGRDMRRTRFNPYENVLDPTTVAGLRPAWTRTLPGVGNEANASASVAVWRGVLYTGAYNGHVYAIRVSDGRVLWNVNVDNEVAAALTIRRGIVYADTWGGVLALRAADGRQLWHRFDSFLTGSVAVSAGLAVIPDVGNVVALDARTGVRRWSTDMGGGNVSSSPAISGTTVLVTTSLGLTALDLESGRVLWQRGFGLDGAGDPVGSTVDPAVVDGVAYVADGGGILHAIDLADGSEIWSSDTGARTQENPATPLTAPAVADGIIYLGTAEWDGGDTIAGHMIAIRASDGELAWSHTVGNREFVRSAPTVANGVVYDGRQSGALFALNAQTGAQLWSSNTGGAIGNASPGSSPVIVDGRLYIGTDDLRLHAYALPNFPDSTARPAPSSLAR